MPYITNLNIKHFKCFNNFKVDGLARVNLITGKNNVGKTALMEAIGINVYARKLLIRKNYIKCCYHQWFRKNHQWWVVIISMYLR